MSKIHHCQGLRPKHPCSLEVTGALAVLLTVSAIVTFGAQRNRFPNAPKVMPQLTQPRQGVLIEDSSGSVIDEQNADTQFNPASAVKLLTAYAVLKKLGPDYQFKIRAKSEARSLRYLLKDMLARSDNQMSTALGRLVGGTNAIAKVCRADFGLAVHELSIATASGLGVNRVTPRAMIAALRALTKLAQKHGLVLSDLLPIAGVDRGTLHRRFAGSPLEGVLVGKTGTLKRTDGGASVLVGQISTSGRGEILFVIFQRGRNTAQLRESQNEIIKELLTEAGGRGTVYSAEAEEVSSPRSHKYVFAPPLPG